MSVGYYRYLIEKVTSIDVRTTNISQSLPTKWRKTADMKILRHWHPMYTHYTHNWTTSQHRC